MSVTKSSRVHERYFNPWQLLRLGGGALLVATGAVHLDLYLTGYDSIPTIGWLFLLQIISAFTLAAATIGFTSRILCGAGAGFFASTLAGYLWSLRIGLFGFREVRTTAGIAAGLVEILGFTTLAVFATRPDRAQTSASPTATRHPIDQSALLAGRWVSGVLALLAATTFALSLSDTGAAPTNTAGSAVVKVTTIHGVSVLTNAHGDTLYWFAPDTSTASHCYGTCAAYWPPLTGDPVAGPGVIITGSLSTLKRSDGALQVTYDGHPLYTYVGDAAPGQASGNRIHLNGGEWYEMKESK
ncbi:MAG: hypothetical protein ABSA07_11570 [Acidimicrobiales bacterium]